MCSKNVATAAAITATTDGPAISIATPTLSTGAVLGAAAAAEYPSKAARLAAIGPLTHSLISGRFGTPYVGAAGGVQRYARPKSSESTGSAAACSPDDSGIHCRSESDRVSLNRAVRESSESLDSGEMEVEEECLDILETTSMDEEYGLMQSDLCFYQTGVPDADCRTLRASRNKKRMRDVDEEIAEASAHSPKSGEETPQAVNDETATPSDADVVDGSATPTPTATQVPMTPLNATPDSNNASACRTPLEPAKNEVLFKSFFGATKNAIFRTAQSIIENHEKKSAAKTKPEEAAPPTEQLKSPTESGKKKEFFSLITSSSSKKAAAAAAAAAAAVSMGGTPDAELPDESKTPTEAGPLAAVRTLNLHLPCHSLYGSHATVSPTSSLTSLHTLHRVPGVVKCFIKEPAEGGCNTLAKTERGPSGLLRFFESSVFNIHFAVHYLFYSKEPGVLSFIGNKIFSFPDHEVDLYIPQLIVMYIQMDELAAVLDPYLTERCRRSVDFSLKCLWLLEAYHYQVDALGAVGRKSQLSLMKEIFSKKERKVLSRHEDMPGAGILPLSPLTKKTHFRSQSDATVLFKDGPAARPAGVGMLRTHNTKRLGGGPPAKLCLGELTSGRAFDNGCSCFDSVRGQVNDLLGQKTVCACGAPKTAPQKEFMKALINVGKNIASLPTKAEKTSALRMSLNLINKNLPARVWLPLHADTPHHVVRITEKKTAVLNSKDKTPYIIYIEVVEVPDIYSSPLIPKMMPTLRHTKSEERLDGLDGAPGDETPPLHASCSRTSSSTSHSSHCHRRREQMASDASSTSDAIAEAAAVEACGCNAILRLGRLRVSEDDAWSQEDDAITAQYMSMRERDTISQLSLDSCDSRDHCAPLLFNIGDVRARLAKNLSCAQTKSFSNDPEDPSAAALKEPWHEKEKHIRATSPYGHLSNWRLLAAIVKCGDDLRQELMATQLLQMFKIIWQEEDVDLWVRPYKIVCLSNDSGLIEPITNTVSLHQIKKNSNKSLRDYFIDEYGSPDGERFRDAQQNFVQSCAAYSLISYLLQVKDRHNGNILLHADGHIIHIDFGFILSISPKNLGFEQSPFKLTPEFVEVMGGTDSENWREFNRLQVVGMMTARKHMDRIINFVEIMRSNAQLPCFRNGCSGTIQNLRKRFHMNLTEQEMERKVDQLVQDSLKSLSTKLYDDYQYYTNGIL